MKGRSWCDCIEAGREKTGICEKCLHILVKTVSLCILVKRRYNNGVRSILQNLYNAREGSNRMKGKHFGKSIFAIGLGLACLLGGCGKEADPSASKQSESSSAASVQESSSTPAADTSGEHFDIDLMAYFVMDVSADDEIIQYLNEKFNVTINPIITNWDNYASTLQMKIAAQELPDWFRVNDESIVPQLVDDGLVINVSDYVPLL